MQWSKVVRREAACGSNDKQALLRLIAETLRKSNECMYTSSVDYYTESTSMLMYHFLKQLRDCHAKQAGMLYVISTCSGVLPEVSP